MRLQPLKILGSIGQMNLGSSLGNSGMQLHWQANILQFKVFILFFFLQITYPCQKYDISILTKKTKLVEYVYQECHMSLSWRNVAFDSFCWQVCLQNDGFGLIPPITSLGLAYLLTNVKKFHIIDGGVSQYLFRNGSKKLLPACVLFYILNISPKFKIGFGRYGIQIYC